MCGIAAILFFPMRRKPEVQEEIQQIFMRNLIFNEERGNAATGLSVIRMDGQIQTYKEPCKASSFVYTSAFQKMTGIIDEDTLLWLGHTRLPTKGDPSNNDNNHPIFAGDVIGVHNGRINNDDILFRTHNYPRKAQVDSEIIFWLLSDVNVVNREMYLERVCQKMKVLQGQFTFLAVDRRRPQYLLVSKHHNPLCVHYHAPWQALIFSSRYIFLRKSFGRAVLTEALPHDEIMCFDAFRIPKFGSIPSRRCSLV